MAAAAAAAAAAYSTSSLWPLPSFPPPRPSPSYASSSRFSSSSSSSSPSSSRHSSPAPAFTITRAGLLAGAAGLALAASACAFAPGASAAAQEPANALSLPTWVVHVSSVAEWVAAMALVWDYGERSGFEAWKGLSWGMVPLLGGAFCACTWHFFYNSESLEILVAIQAALTVIGNITMCIAAFRICKAAEEGSKNF